MLNDDRWKSVTAIGDFRNLSRISRADFRGECDNARKRAIRLNNLQPRAAQSFPRLISVLSLVYEIHGRPSAATSTISALTLLTLSKLLLVGFHFFNKLSDCAAM